MKIILNRKSVIVAKGEDVYEVSNGIFVDGVIYAEPGLTVAETEQEFQIQKDKFVNGAVVRNEDYVAPPASQEELLQKLKSATQIFAETSPSTVNLETFKALRIEALKEECTASIYAGFESASTGASFGFNSNDQLNFTQLSLRIVAANGNYTKPIQWKTLSGSIVTLSVDEFNTVLDEAESHKVTQQVKFWQLEGKVLAATTAEEVLALAW